MLLQFLKILLIEVTTFRLRKR